MVQSSNIPAKLPLSRCSQHSTAWGGPCSRAIDGNTDQSYSHNSCTHTNTARGAWWQARTSRRARITSVTIHNRRDCCAERLNDFVIKVDGRECASYRSSTAFSVRTFACNRVGRTVRIETRNYVPLTLCEVQVHGHYVRRRPRPSARGLRFIGCFVDNSTRDLPVMAGSGSMTVRKCFRLCKARRFAFFGVQYSKECWCGNSYGRYGKRSNGECRMRCTGNRSAFCGASWRNSIYTTGLPVPKPRPSLKCPAGTKSKFIRRRTCSCIPAPEERRLGSLIFVIDVTGSMGRVIRSVKDNIRKILSSNTRFTNYIIATFGDPYMRNVRKTTNAAELKRFLDGLVARGGGDCPEFAMSGARDAADMADPNSVMMLFTDASAKDAHLRSAVASRLHAKQIRLFFVSTGNMCGVGTRQFDQLAKDSNGQVSRLASSTFGKLMQFVNLAVNGRMSFSAFPTTAKALDNVLRGHCGCRTISRRFCVSARPTPGLRRIGCFVDASTRDLPILGSTGSMSVYKCYRECRKRRYAYFGLQYSKECWCGNSYGRYGARSNNECNMRCSGDSSAFCGAGWRNIVFATGLPRPVDPTPGLRFVGCYVDNGSRDLPVLATSGAMNLPKCYRACRGRNYAFFGVQNSNECWCGNSYGLYGVRSTAECNMRCSGDSSKFCGAGWRNGVYSTGLKAPVIPTPGLRLIGCYVDNSVRDLPELAASGSMTITRCYHLCRRKNFAHFGVQNANECWCGNSYGRYGSRPTSECRSACDGNRATFCGGAWRNNVYSTGLTLSPPMPGLRPIGCFVDNGSRDLPKLAGSGSMNVPKCYRLCRGQNYMYFGVQNGNECWCGNSYGRFGVRQIIECQMRCSGDRSTYCGAGWRNNVYATGVNPPAMPTPSMRAMGCYVDSGARDLPVLAERGNSMRVPRCYQLCRSKNYMYFGVQNSDECWCGNTYGRHGLRPASECNLRCRGDGTTFCGAAWRNSIYSTGLTITDVMPGLRDVGCFLDSANRDLPTLAGTGSMTIEKCYQSCRQRNAAYFGLQNSNECWCGDSYGKHGGRRASECSAKCTGDSRVKCGAAWRNNVYATGLGLNNRVKLPMSSCSQHSTTWSAPCQRAIDGNTNQDFFKHSCTHTASARGAWWQAKTERLARITEITIHNRQDCCANRLTDFVVKVDGQECVYYQSTAAFSVRTFICNLIGRTVRIETRKNDVLTLCEVQVFGHFVAARSWPPAAGVKYLGCYVDNGNRDLPLLNRATVNTARTFCFNYCKSRGYLYFGVQNGDHCTCGNSYGAFGRASESQCRSQCQGEKSTYCGGPWRNAVYTTGLTVPLKATPGMRALGCFVDGGARDLPVLAGSGSMSVFKCYELCQGRKYRFFGVQNSNECWCGNHYGRHGIRSHLECRMQCTGDKTSYCGAAWRNMIYTTGLDIANEKVGVRRLGCYVDTAQRDLPLVYSSEYQTTKAFCWTYCKDRGFKYFAMQYGGYCTCGNTFGRYGKASEASCNVPCRGDRETKCGGGWRNDIYTTGLQSQASRTPGMVHLGCFVDGGARDLPKLGGSGSMTVSKCYNLCRSQGYRFFGVQYSNECYCGNHYGRYGRRDKNECRMQCTGDKTTYCGAGWRNDVFTTGLEDAVSGESFLGCFVDNGVRDLPLVQHAAHQATKSFCLKLCKNRGYKYAGLQNGDSCTCGNLYGALGRVDNSQCNMKCRGDEREKCGAGWRNAIYTTGLSTKPFSAPGLKYLGCYVDGADRDLPHLASASGTSVPKCYELCRKLNYRFFAVQYSSHCFCGNHYGRFGIRPNTECRMQCSEDKTTYCGAGWRNSVYTTGLEVASIAEGVRDLGCYVDNGSRDLPHVYDGHHRTSKAFCFKYCRQRGYRYFGLQAGFQCTCGNEFGRYGRADASACSTECRGEKQAKCGGSWRNQIFTTGLGSRPFTPAGMETLGCFVDAGTRDLTKLAGSGTMTVEKCYGLCKNLGFRFFGVQNGEQCFCGNNYGRYGRRDKNECRMQCSGDKTTYCGAGWRNTIFTTGIEDVPAGISYLGCFIDNASRDLPLVQHAAHEATKSFCLKLCKNRGYKYAGLQNGDSCTCGNLYGAFGRVDNSQCNMKCRGDEREKCGAGWRNAIYTTGLTSSATPMRGLSRLGCYVDSGSRDLPHLGATGSMSVSKCYSRCRALGYRFFGVQNGNECWCGNHYGRYGIRPNIECRMQCSGERTTYCGAGWRNNVFTTGIEVATAAAGVHPLGCFVDNGQRDLPHYHDAGHEATKEYCWAYCRKAGFKYFGLQYSRQCFCGNTYGRYGRGSDDTCNMQCLGDKRSKCGGSWRNQIFTTGLASRAGDSTPGMVHIGCFVDAATRDLTKLATTGSMTISKCYGLCKKQGFRFFGVQDGNQCFCGNHYGRYGRRDKNECRKQCDGDKTTYCGAGWRNDIFTTGIEEKSSGVVHLGCYIDNASRDLPLVHTAAHQTTKDFCLKYCKERGYKYFGLQNGDSCTCGNSYGLFGRVDSKQCNMECRGDRRRTCGAGWRNAIYTTGLAQGFVPSVKSLGCYIDSSSRDLPFLASSSSMTINKCYGLCRGQNYMFFGVQNGNECWCGNSYGRHGARPKTECRAQCVGDKATYCGAAWRNSIYATGVEVATERDGVKLLGCFVDNARRDLPVLHHAAHQTNKAFCWKFCQDKGYVYFGLQNGDHCTCGNSYGSFGRASESTCRTPCLGDKGAKCGGPYRNEVFTTGVQATPLTAPGMKHIGCFADSSTRDLPHMAASANDMSVLSCRLKCKKLGYRFFGVQFAKECWCGNTYGRHGRRDQIECRMQCTGDKASYCGSSWRNDIYTTGIELEASTCPIGTQEKFIPERTCSCKPPTGQHSLGSLVFVIDTTGSMGSVIQSVKDNIRRILAANKRFDDFVVAAFGDPYVKQLKKTTSASEITQFLNKLRANGGGDCPEFALSGALDAAEAAEPNSVMVLFTDASAKDKNKADALEAKLKAKRIRFFTVASGNLCGTAGSEYSKLATATFGQFSQLSTKTSDKVMDFIKRGAGGDLSFSAFPSDITGLDDVLRGKCPCRTINRRICVKPHSGFLGCYKDEDSTPEMTVASVSNDMTVWKCNDICKAKKLPYFGLKNGKICGCADQYGNSGDVANALCDTVCSGSAGEKCGGGVYNGVFEVK